ncbi:MAG: flagellar motor protein MotB [Alphaproteobacteria bacterium]|jgi:flagellar motor protein MotB
MALHLKISIRRAPVLAAALASLLLSGCSWTPDWANPVEWYNGTRDLVTGTDSETQDARDRAKAKSDQGTAAKGKFPNLASVPDRPSDISSSTQRGQVQQGLVADRSQSRHAALGPGDNRMSTLNPSSGPGSAPPPIIASPPVPSRASVANIPAPPARTPSAPYAPPIAASAPIAAPAPIESAMSQVASIAPRSQAAAPSLPDGSMGVRQAFQQALAQSGGIVNSAPPAGSGVRDMNQSSVPMTSRRDTMPVPPMPRGSLALKAPPGTAPVSRGLYSASAAQSSVSVQVGTVLFTNGSSKLSKKDVNILNYIVKIKKEKGGTVRVIGHASSRTRDLNPLRHRLVNFRLSLARANVVAQRLVRLGIPVQDVQVMAKADNEPVYYEFMPAGEAGNRRAEIYLDY